MINIFFYPTEIGNIAIMDDGQAITNLYFAHETIPADAVRLETALLQEAGRQLQSYLAGRLRAFDLPLAPAGTEFRQRVWGKLQAIPYGQTRSYQDIALGLGNARACRAVGQAAHDNPIPIFIPCHRLIGTDGSLTGYAGGLAIKAFLLRLEKQAKASK